MKMKLKKMRIKKFKSLRDCEIGLRDFNVKVGENASWKINLVEAFKLLKKMF